MSPQGLDSARKIFEEPGEINSRTPLVPESVCREFIERIDQEHRHTPDARALAMVGMLLGQMPSVNAHNTKVYHSALGALFAAYPESVGRKALDPVNGLVAKLEYAPKPSDLKKFLDAEMQKRDTQRANALSHIAERKRREQKQREEAEEQRATTTPEQRREAVKRLLGYNPL